MRITELFTAQSIALDEALQTQEEILSRLVELQATHGNITDKEAYKKALYAREAEGSTYVDNGITVPHAKTNVVTRPSLAALRLSTPVQYNAEDDGTTDLLFAIAAPENGSLHVDMLARMMQMLMNEDFVEKLKAAKTPKEFLECIDAQEEAQFGAESFTQQAIPQDGYRILAVTACVNGIAHTYMAAEALTKAGDKLGLPTKVETNGSDGAKNILTRAEIAACDGIIVAAEKKVDTARFDGKPVLFTRVDDGIHKPEELIKKIAHGEVPVFHAEGGAAAEDDSSTKDSFGRTLYKNLMNGVSHMLPFVVGGGIMIALAFLLDDYSINPANFGMNTPIAAFFKTVGGAAFGYMLPILAGFIAMSIADRPGLAVGSFSFKHTGLFPEQAVNWDWFSGLIHEAGHPVKVLNLFAYTGGATVSAAAAGAAVTHVDASKGMVGWAKENAAASGLADAPIRWLVDDCMKFVEREIRRGNKYDGIIMDPPSYGRGPKGEIWKIEDNIWDFVGLTAQLLSDDALFFLINSYTTGLQPAVLSYMMNSTLTKKFGGLVEAEEIGLPVTESGLVLPCGASGRWQRK